MIQPSFPLKNSTVKNKSVYLKGQLFSKSLKEFTKLVSFII